MATIMIIDDSPFMRGSLKFLCERAGHKVIATAENTKEAVELYISLRPDIVTLDLKIDNEEGLSNMKKLRQINPSIKMIVVSSKEQHDQIAKIRQIGDFGHIEKPYNYVQVKDEIARLAK